MRVSYILFVFILLMSGCSNGEKAKDHLGEIYSVALDAIMEKDEALSENMKYIAIKLSNDFELTEGDKDQIASFFKEKYQVNVMFASLQDLESQGLVNEESNSIEGVLLRIDSIDIKWNNSVAFEGSKFKSGLGAIGVEGKVHFKEGKWRVKELTLTWIS